MDKSVFSFSLLKLVMASITLTLTGNSSSLNSYFYPEIELDERYSYSCCLLDFYSFNSIPNVNETNNTLIYSKDGGVTFEEITIPTGQYEVGEIVEFLESEFQVRELNINIEVDKSTMKCSIYLSEKCMVDFSKKNSIGSVLGFTPNHPFGPVQGSTSKDRFGPRSHHVSNKIIDIQAINNLKIDCDLITGSYHNGMSTHTIYEFDLAVDPGYKIIEQPKHLIYLPIVRHRISTVNISILDQKGKLIDFRGENITCRIHIKRDG